MAQAETIHRLPSRTGRFSFLFIAGTLVLVGALRLAAPLLVILFAYLALTKLYFFKRVGKWLAVVFFLIVVAAVVYGLGYVVNQAVRTLPEVADQAVPSIIQWAKQHQIEPPFSDFDTLKEWATETVKSEVRYVGSVAKFARGATAQLVFGLIGLVVAISIFLNPHIELDDGGQRPRDNPYSVACARIAERFATLYRSFATVMGAQIVISAINTVFTTIFVLATHLPHPVVVIGLTFLCGLVPIIGNLVSNSIIVGIAFTISPERALLALGFLIFIHKLEYFLNGKIIGHRIENPLWLTLLALLIGERLVGLPGLVLAPVILYYIKLEASSVSFGDLSKQKRQPTDCGGS